MEPLFSVILPVYNSEKTVEKAIKSVLNDQNFNVELIVINDGSTDNSEYIINKYINDKRLSYYYQENSGVSAARNYGISVAKGEYISFLDSDDYFSPDAFTKLTKIINKYESDIIGFGFYLESFDINNIIKKTNANSISQILDFDISNASSELKYIFNSSKILIQTSWNKIFKRKLIFENNLKFNTNLVCYENLTFIFDIMSVCKKITFVSDILYHYCSYDQIVSDVLLKRKKTDLTYDVSVCMKKYIKIADKYNYTSDFRFFMYEQFLKDFTYCSKKIFMPENNISKKERLKLFSNFLDNEMFLYLKQKYVGSYKFYKLIYFLHENKLDFLAYEIYKKKIL